MKKRYRRKALRLLNDLLGGQGRIDTVAYGPQAAMAYDEYPAHDPAAPIVMFWHGGSWSNGHKEMYRFVGRQLQKLGAHAIVVGYPLYPEQTFPGFIDDAKLAITHVRARYPGRKVFVMGHSSGAHVAVIAAMTSFKEPVDGVIALSTVCTISPRYWAKVFGKSFENGSQDPRNYIANSPKQTRYLILHGAIDITVLVADSISLHKQLRAAGRHSQLSVLKVVDHMLIVPLISFGPLVTTRWRIKRFIFAD